MEAKNHTIPKILPRTGLAIKMGAPTRKPMMRREKKIIPEMGLFMDTSSEGAGLDRHDTVPE